MARLKDRYNDEIRPALVRRFGYSSVMQAPRLEKVTLNMGVGEAKQDSKMLEAAQDQLATIAGQRPSVRRARKSVAAFKLREGMPVGVIEKEGPIHVSNVAIVDPKDHKPTRVGVRRDESGTRMRIAKRSGSELD